MLREDAIQAAPRGVELVALLRELRGDQVDRDGYWSSILPGPDDGAGSSEKSCITRGAGNPQEFRGMAGGTGGVRDAR